MTGKADGAAPARALEVVKAGALMLVQDTGRPGLAAIGVSRSGAADRSAYGLGARLLGHEVPAGGGGRAALEVLMGGCQLRARGDLAVALTGAPARATVDGVPVAFNAVVQLRDGQVLRVGVPTRGLRTYLSVRGGIDVPEVLGSRSTDTLAHLGPDPVTDGTVLPVGDTHGLAAPTVDAAAVAADPPEGALVLDLLPGPRADWLADPAALWGTSWTVTQDSDRVGVRLDGGDLARHPDTAGVELPSEGAVRGTVQVPPNGKPVLFLADHPVTGGYPSVAVLTAESADLAAQARPGQRVRLRRAPGWQRVTDQVEDIALVTPAAARARFRAGLAVPTTGWCRGYTQANVIALPRELAFDFLLFAQRNPTPCPVLDVLEPGRYDGELFTGDIRTDIGRYRVYRHGELVDEPTDVLRAWRKDLVTFLLGCSFTFEHPLIEAGIPIRHVEAGRNVAMYRTNRPCRPTAALHGPLVVSMRPIPADRVEDAVRISGRFPAVHGAPVHVGDPAELGIEDVHRPDFGDPPVLEDGDIPVFWGCGVTPQAMAMAARPELAITHAPGYMLITDVTDDRYDEGERVR